MVKAEDHKQEMTSECRKGNGDCDGRTLLAIPLVEHDLGMMKMMEDYNKGLIYRSKQRTFWFYELQRIEIHNRFLPNTSKGEALQRINLGWTEKAEEHNEGVGKHSRGRNGTSSFV